MLFACGEWCLLLACPIRDTQLKGWWKGPVHGTDLLQNPGMTGQEKGTNAPKADETKATSAPLLGEAVRGTFHQ